MRGSTNNPGISFAILETEKEQHVSLLGHSLRPPSTMILQDAVF